MDTINNIKDLFSANIDALAPIITLTLIILFIKIPYIRSLINKSNEDDSYISPKDKEEKEKRRQKRKILNQALRELRAEISDLNSSFDDIKQGKTTVTTIADYIQKTNKDVKKLFSTINDLNEDFHSDTIRNINNYWEQMKYNPILVDPSQSMSPQDQLHHLSMLEAKAKKMILAICFLTIPHRVNIWLQQSRPGYYLPFHLLFEEDLPSAEDRQRVINTMAWAPKAMESGIINIESGLIYRYDPRRSAQYCGFLFLLLIFYTLSVGIWLFGKHATYFGLTDITPKLILLAWLAVLAGMFIHIIIGKFKRSQETGLPQVVATSDWLIYVSAHKGDITLKLLTALFGLFAFTFSSGSITMISSFLLGYSLDSFIGVFGSSLEKKAEAQYSSLYKKIQG
ncbi:coiled-coil domain-containing protein [Methylomarinum vadi]|uniref:hypothetical protein n=1 Tax=Methylomarinum vadi TaxID=438855 RepID=UPI0004DF6EC4|nr:hypothetical protein [Methylomarinum vadi]